MRYSRTIGILIAGLLIAALAQQVFVRADTAPRPAQDMLTWGESYFPYPDWLASFEERTDQVTGTWKHPGKVVHRRQMPGFKGTPIDQVDKDVDDNWIKATMSEYSSWETLQRCVSGDYVVVNFSAHTKDDPTNQYQVRYWVWADDKSWSEVFVAFDKAHSNDLETLADTLFGDAARCAGSGAGKPEATTAQ